jgi:predicted SAM-dependent methyltransferase
MKGQTLNLGCGDKILDECPVGYKCVNLDNRDLPGVDVVADVRKLPFEDESFDYMIASDIIEHFPLSETGNLINEWVGVLKVGGTIKIRTPNLKFLAEHYLRYNDASFVSKHVFGGQDYPGNFHYIIFDRLWLATIFKQFGLMEVDYKEEETNFVAKYFKGGGYV